MNILKTMTVIFTALTLVSCATTVEQPPVIVAPTPPVIAPRVDPVNLRPIRWKVYTIAELKILIANAEKNGTNVVLFTLDGDNFKILSDNLVDIQKLVHQQQTVIVFLTTAANAPSASATKK